MVSVEYDAPSAIAPPAASAAAAVERRLSSPPSATAATADSPPVKREEKKRRKPSVHDVFNQDDDGSDGPKKRKLGERRRASCGLAIIVVEFPHLIYINRREHATQIVITGAGRKHQTACDDVLS